MHGRSGVFESKVRCEVMEIDMIRRGCVLFVLFLGSLGSIPAFAHHNAAAHYQLDKIVTVEGVVTEFKLINPHVVIRLQVKNAAGKMEAWMAEGDAAAVLRRRGWTGREMKTGDAIKVIGHPSRDGSKMIEWKSIVLPNGVEMGGGNGLRDERDKSLEELDKQRRANPPKSAPSAPPK